MHNQSWIRVTRKKRGLKGFQLAERLNVSAARVSMLEKDEGRGAVTLKMMDRVAKAMGCRFEYRLVPNEDPPSLNVEHSNTKPRYRLMT
jgi:transcriptional regulator with XRE-family HTH domain